MTKTNDETLRMAAIAAVMSVLSQSGEDPGQMARKPGLAWSQDHRRMNMGQSSLMHQRASRSPWK
ncbi:hypothetical protein N9X79_00185 [Euryarchaeota archaeon]|nr:hypothetical protein [Euryarchaeota archaeon]MDA9829167.1 hypothetical protein [Candidatus Poseidoniaceae archaeon]MDA8609755.1 hypothetical protein [Euryarchaeota archaeon]MDA8701353.1 hypothetical protein [Euryarchaeota archaeon]MDA8727954.1 hypothetical protein [Euryarchaeota archaeon]